MMLQGTYGLIYLQVLNSAFLSNIFFKPNNRLGTKLEKIIQQSTFFYISK